jgi:hypothetical protein
MRTKASPARRSGSAVALGGDLAEGNPSSGESASRSLLGEPVQDDLGIVDERDLLEVVPQLFAHDGQVVEEGLVSSPDLQVAGHGRAPGGIPQPVAHPLNRLPRIAAMSLDILPGDVRQELLVAVLLAVQDKARLGSLLRATVPLATEEQAEFEGHVEPGQSGRRRFGPGDVVDAVAALGDDSFDLG